VELVPPTPYVTTNDTCHDPRDPDVFVNLPFVALYVNPDDAEFLVPKSSTESKSTAVFVAVNID
jgi:hypothetical protein